MRPSSSTAFCRIFLGLLLALFLASCSNPKNAVNWTDAPATVEHDSTSETGIVVIGIRAQDGNPNSESLIGLNASIGLNWRLVDLESGKLEHDTVFLNDRADFTTKRFTCHGQPACNYNDYTEMQYNLVKVWPGHYLLKHIAHQNIRFTNMVPYEESLLFDTNPAALYEKKLVPGFEIKPGEIVYIGNYILNVLGDFPELVRIESNPEEARQTLALYPGVSGEMVVRVPEIRRYGEAASSR